MKALIAVGILLMFVGASTAANTESSGAWMVQDGLVLLLGALALFQASKGSIAGRSATWGTIEILSFSLMLLLTAWGFLGGMWDEHPLGFIIALVGCVWIYLAIKSVKGASTKKSRVERLTRILKPPPQREVA